MSSIVAAPKHSLPLQDHSIHRARGTRPAALSALVNAQHHCAKPGGVAATAAAAACSCEGVALTTKNKL